MLDGNQVFALNEAADVLACRHVLEGNIARPRTKEGNSGTDQHWDTGNNDALNETGLKKPLNGDPAIDVNVPDAARGKLRRDVGRSSRHALHDGSGRHVETARQDVDLFRDAYTGEFVEFTDALREGRAPSVTGVDAKRALMIALACIESMQAHAPVKVTP